VAPPEPLCTRACCRLQIFSSKGKIHIGHSKPDEQAAEPLYNEATKKWRGDTVFSVLTSSGDNYQNYQTRIL
jgi:hypothetical protein